MELYKATSSIIQLFNDNPIVHTITTEDSTNIDYNKTNIYPLVNIELIDSYPSESSITQVFNYEIIVIQQQDIVKDLNADKYDYNNTLDNHNECNQILMAFVNSIKMHQYMNLVNQPTFTYLYNSGHNGCDGVQTFISIEVYDDEKFC